MQSNFENHIAYIGEGKPRFSGRYDKFGEWLYVGDRVVYTDHNPNQHGISNGLGILYATIVRESIDELDARGNVTGRKSYAFRLQRDDLCEVGLNTVASHDLTLIRYSADREKAYFDSIYQVLNVVNPGDCIEVQYHNRFNGQSASSTYIYETYATVDGVIILNLLTEHTDEVVFHISGETLKSSNYSVKSIKLV
ncbi:hypothetical protein ABGV42_00365 [Paenibacillus pabuli]|uniref:hypothetical protein n=1 Tax=Paenibacillus pabuli TaxID=1472 RepID=UPI003241D60C